MTNNNTPNTDTKPALQEELFDGEETALINAECLSALLAEILSPEFQRPQEKGWEGVLRGLPLSDNALHGLAEICWQIHGTVKKHNKARW